MLTNSATPFFDQWFSSIKDYLPLRRFAQMDGSITCDAKSAEKILVVSRTINAAASHPAGYSARPASLRAPVGTADFNALGLSGPTFAAGWFDLPSALYLQGA
jgi:hypothetical protein